VKKKKPELTAAIHPVEIQILLLLILLAIHLPQMYAGATEVR
jgi:hypothetical protein